LTCPRVMELVSDLPLSEEPVQEDPNQEEDQDGTEEGGEEGKKGQKRKLNKYYRIHAHRNPLNDADFQAPISPEEAIWGDLYPKIQNVRISYADIGCGYGGLLVSLGELFPEKQSLGIEIRPKVVEYVQQRIQKLRTKHAEGTPNYQNIAVICTNAMKYFPNYFFKGQLEKIFFLFPDPHFKKSNHRRRIISHELLAEYAFALAIGGKIYTITDVKELHEWMVGHIESHPLFVRVPDEENDLDPVIPSVRGSSEEANKVEKSGGSKYLAVFRRIENPNSANMNLG